MKQPPVIVVLGLHRSGSSCLAGVLHKLGICMGKRMGGYEESGGYEAKVVTSICEDTFPFGSTKRHQPHAKVQNRLVKHFAGVQEHVDNQGDYYRVGVKYPSLCAMHVELLKVCPDLRIVHARRPLAESIKSLQSRSAKCTGMLGISADKAESLQRFLDREKAKFMRQVPQDRVCHVNYEDLLTDTRATVAKLVRFLEIAPTAKQLEGAVRHVDPAQRHFVVDPSDQQQDKPSDVSHAIRGNIKNMEPRWNPNHNINAEQDIFKKLKVCIIRLRRGVRVKETWPIFDKMVKDHLEFFIDQLNSRWLVSILDTYIDHGTPTEQRSAATIVAIMNMERFSATSKPKHFGKNMWDGLETVSKRRDADGHINFMERLGRLLAQDEFLVPIMSYLLNTAASNPQSVISSWNRVSSRNTHGDMNRAFGRGVKDGKKNEHPRTTSLHILDWTKVATD